MQLSQKPRRGEKILGSAVVAHISRKHPLQQQAVGANQICSFLPISQLFCGPPAPICRAHSISSGCKTRRTTRARMSTHTTGTQTGCKFTPTRYFRYVSVQDRREELLHTCSLQHSASLRRYARSLHTVRLRKGQIWANSLFFSGFGCLCRNTSAGAL